MARPKIAAGEVGQVQVTQLANGKWRARARMRDDAGELVQLRAEAATEDAASCCRGAGQGTTVEPIVGMNWHCFSVVVT